MIVIVGIGRSPKDLTLKAVDALKDADEVVLKTALHPCAGYIKEIAKTVISLDEIYETAEDFDALNLALAEAVAARQSKKVVYCVPGSGIGDRSAAELTKRAECAFVAGVADGSEQLFVAGATDFISMSATEFCERKKNLFDTNLTLVLTELNDPYLASDVKLKLLDFYGAEQPIVLNGRKTTVGAIGQNERYGDDTVLAVLPLPLAEKERYDFGDLVEVIYRLRDPDGCQWDRAQTRRSIRGNIVEEAYELIEAIDLDDSEKMREEAGDVVLQGIFTAVIADDEGDFNVNDVISDLTKKLITRHTHIFGENKAKNQDEALAFWEAAKAKEKGQKSLKDKLDSVPETFSALMYANKSQKYTSKEGCDFLSAEDAAKKVPEELKEFFAEQDPVKKEMEGGDLLFAAVNVLRLCGIDPELALNRSTAKYRKRVEYIVKALEKRGLTMKDVPQDEIVRLWEASKSADCESFRKN